MSWSRPGVREAYVVSLVSLVITVLALVLGLVVTFASSSSATLGFALENAVDTFSSALVLWRFWGGGASVPEATLELREKRASVGIAASFVLLGCVVGGVAIQHLTTHDELKEVGTLYALAVPSMLIFFVLGSLKLRIGRATDSASMKKDAACSLCGSLLSLGVILGAALSQNDDRLWFFDALVALVIAAALFAYGLLVLVKNARQRNRWWTAAFWSQGLAASRRRFPEVRLEGGMARLGPDPSAGGAAVVDEPVFAAREMSVPVSV